MLNDNMLAAGGVGGEIRGFMDLADGSEKFGAQIENFERGKLQYQQQKAIGMGSGDRKPGISAKAIKGPEPYQNSNIL